MLRFIKISVLPAKPQQVSGKRQCTRTSSSYNGKNMISEDIRGISSLYGKGPFNSKLL